MCQAKPGPRCASHAGAALDRAREVLTAAQAALAAAAEGEEREAATKVVKEAESHLKVATIDFDATPTGQDVLAEAEAALREDGKGALAKKVALRAQKAREHRARQVAAVHVADAAQALVLAETGFDAAQAESLWRKEFDKAKDTALAPKPEVWAAFVDERVSALSMNDYADAAGMIETATALEALRATPPDGRTFAALKAMPERVHKAARAVTRQQEAIGGLRGADLDAVRERFHAYRDQYATEFAHLPPAQRPDPPAEWVTGFTKKDMMAVSCPQDRATQYAMYRAQADPGAFPANPNKRYASIDLETAGPEGKDGWEPSNGGIIEVGIVECDGTGAIVDRYSTLIHPGKDVLDRCGTGAQHVHGITPADVASAPSWATVAPQVAARLDGRVLMAQNARFEKDWLGHHLPAQGQTFEAYGPQVDTLTIARQHWANMPNHQLGTLCQRVGVAYTNGHRAEHDAEVTARAFFRIRERIFAEYQSDPVRARTPQPAPGAGARVRRVQRARAGHFDPQSTSDAWTVNTAA